jgi:pyruvate formate lyase activating enzyme
MQIRDFIKESFIDYPGKISAVVFSSGCNYKCPACHAKRLLEKGNNIDEKVFFDYLDSRKGWIDAVVLCGGEPTLQHDLIYFARKIKERGLLVKLDTNGSEFGTLMDLREENLIDYVAMDVKGPPSIYADLIGREFIDARDGYEKSIATVSHFPDYEFRTTVVPVVRRDGEISFLTPEEIGQTAKLIYDCTGVNEHKYFLQKFVPRKGELLDSQLENFPETPNDLMERALEEIKLYLPNAKIR